MTTYVYVDGSSFEDFLQYSSARLNLSSPLKFSYERYFQLLSGEISRIFYYDAYPHKTDSENSAQFEERTNKKENLFKELSRIDGVHVRTGTARHRKRKGVEQKGVDIQLALDAFQHAVHNNTEEAIIITNDLDFYPLLEALTQTKTTSTLIYVVGKTSENLIEAADVARPLSLKQYLRACTDSEFTFERTSRDGDYTSRIPGNFTILGIELSIYFHDDGIYIVNADSLGHRWLCSNIALAVDAIENAVGRRADAAETSALFEGFERSASEFWEMIMARHPSRDAVR